MAHEERLLGLDLGMQEADTGDRVSDPVPANVAGQVLVPGKGEEVVVLDMVAVAARGPGKRGVGQLLPGLAVVECKEEPRPGLRRDRSGEVRRGERCIDGVAWGRVVGKRDRGMRDLELDLAQGFPRKRNA